MSDKPSTNSVTLPPAYSLLPYTIEYPSRLSITINHDFTVTATTYPSGEDTITEITPRALLSRYLADYVNQEIDEGRPITTATMREALDAFESTHNATVEVLQDD